MNTAHRRYRSPHISLLMVTLFAQYICVAAPDSPAGLEIALGNGKTFYLPAGQERDGYVGLIPSRSVKASGLRIRCIQRAQSLEIQIAALDPSSGRSDPLNIGKFGALVGWKGSPIGTFRGQLGDNLSIPLAGVGLPSLALKIVPARRSPLPDGGPFCAVSPTTAAPKRGLCMGMGEHALCCRTE